MPKDLLVLLPTKARLWQGWLVLDLPLQYASKEHCQDERREGEADGEETGKALRGKKSTR